MQFIHVGCGHKRKHQTTLGFSRDLWQETRFDIDAQVLPDILGTITDMHTVTDASFDALFSSHNIEHLYPHEVPLALTEFWRVLKPNGYAVVTCPDLQAVAELVANDRLTEPAYQSPAGPIAPLDILYGFRPSLAKGNLFMAHRCGFTQKTLTIALQSVGFKSVASLVRKPALDLWVVASKSVCTEEHMRALAQDHFPKA